MTGPNKGVLPEDECTCSHQLQEHDFRGMWPCNVDNCVCDGWEAAE